MRYRYEDLGDEEFQQLVQALLAHRLGLGMRAMPLGQADGGRDALHGTAVYQVKFAADPGRVRNPVAWLLSSLDRESDKIARLVARGATDYHLVTNVGGTGRLDAGSIDRLDRELKRRRIGHNPKSSPKPRTATTATPRPPPKRNPRSLTATLDLMA